MAMLQVNNLKKVYILKYITLLIIFTILNKLVIIF